MTAACVLTLGLGMAAVTVMFTLLYSLLLRPLPFPHPDSLVAVKTERGVSWQDVRDLSALSRVFSGAGVYRKRTWALTDEARGPVRVVLSGTVTPGFFSALGLPESELGRSDSLWVSASFEGKYRADSYVFLNERAYRIAGVLPSWFQFSMEGEAPDVYIALHEKNYCCERGARGLSAVARLQSGMGAVEAQEALGLVSQQLAHAYPASNARTVFQMEDLHTALLGDGTRVLGLLGCAAALLMLVAAANAAGILTARAARKLRESAIRASLGVGVQRLLAEQAAQGLWLGFASSALGLPVASFVIALPRFTGYLRIAPWR